jgi:hypothetical protein
MYTLFGHVEATDAGGTVCCGQDRATPSWYPRAAPMRSLVDGLKKIFIVSTG